MKVKILKTTNPEYNFGLYSQYDLLYEGGNQFLNEVNRFLPKRYNEASKLYSERIKRAFYIGYVGPVIDYFSSNLFALNANINKQKLKLTDSFYNDFLKNVDLKGTEFNLFFKERFTDALIHQSSYILVDFPSSDITPQNRAEEKKLGLDRAYLVPFKKNQLIDWQLDELGNFEWVKFQICDTYRKSFDTPLVEKYRWYIYTKEFFQIFEYEEDENSKKKTEDVAEATLMDQGFHSTPGKVPIIDISVPQGLWVMNKLASVQLELFNLDNALAWQEYQGHYAMPIIKLKDDKEFKQKMGESYFIKLDIDEDFQWTEPEGKMMEVGLKRREVLKDEMFRIIFSMSLSVKQTKTQTRQSGTSKQEDRYATETILRAYGDIIRSSMQKILELVTLARKDSFTWDVSGFSTFDNESTTEKLSQILQLKAINIHSETFHKEVEKQVVDLMLEDLNNDTKVNIKDEIDKHDFSNVLEDSMNAFNFGKSKDLVKGINDKKIPGLSKPSLTPEKPNRTNI